MSRHPTTAEKLERKNHRTIFRGIGFLLFSAGLSLILYTAPPLVQTAFQTYVILKQVAHAEASLPPAKAEKF